MKTRKSGLLQRLTAVLLAGMARDAAPISVLAQESVSENTPEPVEGETKPAQGEDSGEQKDPEKAEGEEETDPEGEPSEEETEQEPTKQDDGTGEETTQPGGGAEQETPTDDGKEEAQEPGSVSDNDTPTESVSENDAGMRTAKTCRLCLRGSPPCRTRKNTLPQSRMWTAAKRMRTLMRSGWRSCTPMRNLTLLTTRTSTA